MELTTKVCTKCKNNKPIIEFNKRRAIKCGYRAQCKLCDKKYMENNKEHYKQTIKAWYEANKEHVRQQKKDHYEANRETLKTYREINKERYKQIKKAWEEANKDKRNTFGAKRRAKKLKATPLWLTKNHITAIESVYEEARILTEATGIRHEVDHIVPLQGKNVCGLHVSWNLRPIPASLNSSKGNKL